MKTKLIAPSPVSYTHLDVYKRQAFKGKQKETSIWFVHYQFCSRGGWTLRSGYAVSYEHLDVYKSK